MTNQTIRIVARAVALPEKVAALKAVLLELIEPSLKEAGCIKYELLQNQSDPTDFTFIEEWASDDAIKAHSTSAHMQAAKTKLEGLLAAELDIRHYHLVA